MTRLELAFAKGFLVPSIVVNYLDLTSFNDQLSNVRVIKLYK